MRTMYGVQHKYGKRFTYSMSMVVLNKIIDQLAIENSVCWYGHVLRREDGHVLRREDGHVLRRALDLEVESRRKNVRPNKTWKKQVEEESVKVDLRREDALC